MTLRSEYTRAVTKEMNRRQKILDTIDDFCRTLTEPERIIVQGRFDGTPAQTIRSRLIFLGIFISYEDLQRLTKIILRPLAAELGIRITREPDGNAAEIIAAGRNAYEIWAAEKKEKKKKAEQARSRRPPRPPPRPGDPAPRVGSSDTPFQKKPRGK